MNNISIIHNCYGCGVCSIVCPQKIIDIKLNDNGFYEPYISNIESCTNCGLCLNCCGFNASELASEPNIIKSFAAWSNDKQVQHRSSSGGIGFEIGKTLINDGFKVCGVKFNANQNRAEHYIAETETELIQSVGSKYIQSFTLTGFQKLKKNQKYLVTGTPCQIDSFRRMIKKKQLEDNYILLDFFCHSVPSMLAWKYYTTLAEKKIGKLTIASWRNKTTGWHNSYSINLIGENKSISSLKSKGDLFYKLFFGDFCCNPACQKKCKYKYTSSSADIRIGDFWGNTYASDNDGVSALIAFTEKGENVINKLKNCTLITHSLNEVAEGQMKTNVGKALFSDLMMKSLKQNLPLLAINSIILLEKVVRKLKKKLC